MNEKPSVVFLIPLASRKVRSNWPTACAYLQQTLRSIRNSASKNYRVVVAANEKPELEMGFDSRIHFLLLKHPFPSHPDHRVAVRLDKLGKFDAAWEYAKSNWQPKYVMKVDADDFISSRLVEWLDNAGGEAGYLIKYGWFWRSESRYLIQRTEYFDRECGSCLIIRSDFADRTGPFLTEVEGVPLDEASSRFAASDHYSLVPGSGISTLLLNESHQRYAAQFAYLGHKLSSVPFNAVVYRTGDPDSVTGTARRGEPTHTIRMVIGRIRRTRFITKSLRREFMLE
jgi:glycosyltransferase involved in cell wall biosynthesis